MFCYLFINFCLVGLSTAAHANGIEWLIVKGVADYADSTDVIANGWKALACIMAASVVGHILKDPNVFRSWPHCRGEGNVVI